MKTLRLFTLLSIALSLLLIALDGCTGRNLGERTNVLTPNGTPEITVMDFGDPLSLDPLPEGWFHRTFFWHAPMDIDFEEKEGVNAIRLETSDSASMLIRHVQIDLQTYPMLSWQWYVEKPISSSLDESTREGDDHPARFFITFEGTDGTSGAKEIIWGNLLEAGAYKFIGEFPHYVARGGNENTGLWHMETVDLASIYQHIWPDESPGVVTNLALFCDSDNTNSSSIAFFANVSMSRAGPKGE